MKLASASPWDGHRVAEVESTSADALAEAAERMARGFAGAWSRPTEAGARERREQLEAFAHALTTRRAHLIELLVREAGKCRADAEAEADLLPRKIAITCEQGLARTPHLGAGPIAWRPRGVAAVIGPANFPLHLLHGLVVPALAVGCTVLAKPSERCLALGQAYAKAAHDCGLDEALAIVQGGPELALELARLPMVATVAAVGGRAMGEALARACAARPETVLALELGGVNHALVLPDAAPEAAVEAIAEGAWKMAGQRCTATRVAHVPRAARERYLLLLARARGRWLPAPDPAGAVGRMISASARARFFEAWSPFPKGMRLVAGATVSSGAALEARATASAAADPLLVAVQSREARASPCYREEQFGPGLVVDAYDTLDEAVARMATNPYRLAASVFTASRADFLDLAARLPYGQVNWNRPTAGARSDLPFGGCGASGNGRPAAVAACTIFADETVVWE